MSSFSNILVISSDCPISPQVNFYENSDFKPVKELKWGISWYDPEQNTATLLKDNYVENVEVVRNVFENNPKFVSDMFIGHIYSHSKYSNSRLNVQPFVRPYAGKDWSMVHSGSLNHGYQDLLPLTNIDFEPVGNTDSEYMLCWFLSQLFINNIRETSISNRSATDLI